MPHPVHLLVVPERADGRRRGLGAAPRRYTRRIHFREGWRGPLGQGRFASFARDERYRRRAARYVERHPVRAKLCRVPWRWRWSSAPAQVAGQDDGVVRVAPLRERGKDGREYVREPLAAQEEELWRRHERTGRPLGAAAFLDRVESLPGRIVRPRQTRPQAKGTGEIRMVRLCSKPPSGP